MGSGSALEYKRSQVGVLLRLFSFSQIISILNNVNSLFLQKDDRIRVLRRNDDGIWEGENLENGTKGLFPFRFVEVMMDQS